MQRYYWLPAIAGGLLVIIVLVMWSAPMIGGTFALEVGRVVFRVQIALANPVAFYRDNMNYLLLVGLISLGGLGLAGTSVIWNKERSFVTVLKCVLWALPTIALFSVLAVMRLFV